VYSIVPSTSTVKIYQCQGLKIPLRYSQTCTALSHQHQGSKYPSVSPLMCCQVWDDGKRRIESGLCTTRCASTGTTRRRTIAEGFRTSWPATIVRPDLDSPPYWHAIDNGDFGRDLRSTHLDLDCSVALLGPSSRGSLNVGGTVSVEMFGRQSERR